MSPVDVALSLVDELASMRRLTSVEAKVLRLGLDAGLKREPVPVKTLADASLHELRRAKGFTQQDLASRVGVHWVTLSKLERGRTTMTFEWAERLAQHLDVMPLELFLRHTRRKACETA